MPDNNIIIDDMTLLRCYATSLALYEIPNAFFWSYCSSQLYNFTIEEVVSELKSLKENIDVIPDDIHAKILKRCHKSLSLPVWMIMRSLLRYHPFGKPQTALQSKNNEVSNFRPIALACIPCKLMESITITIYYSKST